MGFTKPNLRLQQCYWIDQVWPCPLVKFRARKAVLHAEHWNINLNLLSINEGMLIHLLLYSDSNLTDSKNTVLLNLVIKNIAKQNFLIILSFCNQQHLFLYATWYRILSYCYIVLIFLYYLTFYIWNLFTFFNFQFFFVLCYCKCSGYVSKSFMVK